MPALRTVLAALLLLALAPAVRAQTPDAGTTDRYRLAETFLDAGQFERAIVLLEDLHADQPAHALFATKLQEAYESVKRYDDAVALVRGRIDRAGRTTSLLIQLGRLHYLAGDEAEAEAAWADVLASTPGEPMAYRLLATELGELRLLERAIDVLERGRTEIGDTSLFLTELAYLYGLIGRHDDAMRAYLRLLADNPRRVGFVRSRLGRVIEQEDAIAGITVVVEQAVRDQPLYRPYRELLVWLYLEGEQYGPALGATRALDRLEGEDGSGLLAFAREAALAGAYDVAAEAFREILERYPDALAAPEAQRNLGVMLQRQAEEIGERAFDGLGRRIPAPTYEAAHAAYSAYLNRYPGAENYADVLHRLGRMEQDVFRNPEAARSTLAAVIERFPGTPAADEAAFDLGRIAVQEGDLAGARSAFARLEERLRTGDLAERARFELARLHYYQGAFDTATGMLYAMQEHTSADVANDVIEMRVRIAENRGPDSTDAALQLLARADLRMRQRLQADAIRLADSLATTLPGHPAADDALFLQAQALAELAQAPTAADVLLRLPLTYPTSPLADRSLFRAAEIQRLHLRDPAATIETLSRLLERYPGSLHAAEAREIIRSLRAEGV